MPTTVETYPCACCDDALPPDPCETCTGDPHPTRPPGIPEFITPNCIYSDTAQACVSSGSNQLLYERFVCGDVPFTEDCIAPGGFEITIKGCPCDFDHSNARAEITAYPPEGDPVTTTINYAAGHSPLSASGNFPGGYPPCTRFRIRIYADITICQGSGHAPCGSATEETINYGISSGSGITTDIVQCITPCDEGEGLNTVHRRFILRITNTTPKCIDLTLNIFAYSDPGACKQFAALVAGKAALCNDASALPKFLYAVCIEPNSVRDLTFFVALLGTTSCCANRQWCFKLQVSHICNSGGGSSCVGPCPSC